jgi:hypothetical protein
VLAEVCAFDDTRDLFVAEIDFVTPQLKNHSFQQENLSNGRYKIYSHIHPKSGTSQIWFDIPVDDIFPAKMVKMPLGKF